jgi:hypothetical protein
MAGKVMIYVSHHKEFEISQVDLHGRRLYSKDYDL